jgi:hypothetical protein
MHPGSVEAHSGYTFGERPTALYWDGERIFVKKIEARWRDPAGRGFRVRTEDGRSFNLYYHEASDEWRIDPR